MSVVTAVRPSFFEGQYLGSDDLLAIVDYFRQRDARQLLAAHGWGVAAGLQLVLGEIGPGEFQLTVTPGVAVDGYGRVIAVTEPVAVPVDKLLGLSSGPVKIWLRYDQVPIRDTRAGFATCFSEDSFARIEESFALEVGERTSILDRQSGVSVAGLQVNDAREAARATDPDAPLHCDGSVAYQQFPEDDEDAMWLIPLGIGVWQSANNAFIAPTEDLRVAGRLFRRDFGAVTQDILAANGMIRLRDRASPFAADINAACEERAAKAADFIFCENVLKPRELVWVEGPMRSTGDVRLFGSLLEFRDARGRDYVDRTAGGVAIEKIDPLAIGRADNAKGGADLRVLVGPSNTGMNRFTVCAATVAGTTPCDTVLSGVPKLVVQQDGSVGINTAEAPDSSLAAPLTIRARDGDVPIIDENGAAATETVPKIAEFEQTDGTVGWGLDLWTDGETLNLNRRAAELGTIAINADGHVGIGMTEPEARLDVARMPVAPSGGLGNNLWMRLGDGGDGGRVWIEYGSQRAPLLVLSDFDDPPRLQFQQTGAGEDEFGPDHACWIGHITGNQNDFGIIDARRIGLRTETPFTDVTIAGTLGFKPASGPLVYMFESGGSGDDKMVLAHSPAQSAMGLRYVNSGDLFRFDSAASDPVLTVNLSLERVGIGTNSPTQALDVRGSVKLGNTGELFAPGAQANLRIVTGDVAATGTLSRGSQVLVTRLSSGAYRLTFSPAFAAIPFITATCAGNDDNIASIHNLTANGCEVHCYDAAGGNEGLTDTRFMFIAMGAR